MRGIGSRCAVAVAALVLAGPSAAAQTSAPAPDDQSGEASDDDGGAGGDGREPIEIEPIIVEITRSETSLLDVPAAVSVVAGDALDGDRQGLALDEALARVPGVWTQNRYNFAQGLRLSVRGFGARAPFGVRGLAVTVDGIPATTVDGQSQLDGYDPAMIERMEVVRGPASALYGNAAGGVIRLETWGPPDRPEGQAEIVAGSYGRFTQRLRAGAGGPAWAASAHGSLVELGGHRDHAAAERRRAGLKIRRELGEHELTVQARILDAPQALDPGGLTREDFAADPTQANGFNVVMETGDDVAQQQAALHWRTEPAPGHTWEAQAYLQRRDFEQRIPVPPPGPGWIELDRLFGGAGARHTRPLSLGGLRGRLTAGLDAGWQLDDRRRYENQRGVRGELRQDQLEDARAAGLYAQAELPLAGALAVSAGARLDALRLAVADRFAAGDEDRSGERGFLEPSVLAGISWRFADRHAAYANVATAFESPTFVELRHPEPGGRGFNPEVGPQDALSAELGAKGRWGSGAGRYDVAVYAAEVRGELISYEEGGIDYYRNAGRTRRAGVEAAAGAELAPGLEAMAAGSLGRFWFRDYVDAEGLQHAGNAIPGVPRAHGYLELSWRGAGFRIAADVRAATGAYVDDANTQRSEAFADIGLRASREVHGGGLRGRIFAAAENLLGRPYAANVRINPAGGNPFEPAPGRGVYLGVNLSFGSPAPERR